MRNTSGELQHGVKRCMMFYFDNQWDMHAVGLASEPLENAHALSYLG